MKRRKCLRLAVAAVATVVALGGVERTAYAGDAREAQLAQALFDDARRLMEQKRYGEACPKLAESQRLDPGGGTILNLAICHEKEGKLATAKADYDEALAVATRDKRRDRQLIARERLGAIEATIPRISVAVAPGSDLEGLEVKLDGLVLRRAAWGVATAVDPGTHVVEANAPGRTPWSTSVSVAASHKQTVEVPVLAPLSQLPQRPVVVTDDAAAVSLPAVVSTDLTSSEITETVAREPGHANPVFYTALGVMVVAAGTSAITGILAASAHDDAMQGCLPDRRYCRDQATTDAADRARSLAWVSTISLGVAAVSGALVLVIPSRTSSSRTNLRASAAPTANGASFELTGRF